MVWLFNPTKKVGRSPKLQVKWEKEPSRVRDILSNMVIRIKRLDGKKGRVVHRNQVKKVKNAQKYFDTVGEENEALTPLLNNVETPSNSLTIDGNGIPVIRPVWSTYCGKHTEVYI